MASDLDVFPAVVTIDGITYRKTRVYVADGRARVFGVGASGDPEVKLDVSDATVARAARATEFTIDSPLGTWTVRKGGCSCGASPALRSLDPETFA